MKKKKERFVVKITTFVPVVFLIDIILFLKPCPNSNKTLSTPEIIFAICLFFLIITFFYLIVGFVFKKEGTMAFNDGGQEVRREKLMITEKNTSRISQEELEEFFKRPMSHTTEYKIKDFAEALEKSKNDILIQDKRKG